MEMLTTQKLSKRFGSVNALLEVDLQLSPGKIYGLVGNNGAGKTTLFRLLAGLLRPSSGSFTLLGESTPRGLNKARKRVGFLIERPIYYPTMSAPSNLRNIQLLLGRKDKHEISDALELVGLNPNSKQLMHNYSMGMQQRYGIAAALIGDPELLILDEPLNGLDPSGVREMNALFKSLCAQGKTIVLSSHILSELYKTATDYIFMDHGRVIEQISHETLEERCGFQLIVRCPDIPLAAKTLQESSLDCELLIEENCLRLPHCTATAGEISRLLKTAGLVPQIETSGITLEDYFFGLLEKHS